MADIKINGATPSAFYVGSTAATAVYFGSTKLWPASSPTPVLPPYTIRCKFNTMYTPNMGDSQDLVDADENIWDIYKGSDTWNGLFSGNSSLISVIAANTTGITDMSVMFYNCTRLTSVPLFDTRFVTTMSAMFYGCTSLTSVPLFDTRSATTTASMFNGCTSLTSVPLFDTSSVTGMGSMFKGCTSLASVPLFDTHLVTSMINMFSGCYAVESGALALYQQASTQANPPTNHTDAFKDCGRDTVTGAAELALIPSSWGGTGA